MKASSQEFTTFRAANEAARQFSMSSVKTKKWWIRHTMKNRINTCPRYHAAKVIDSLMKKEWRETLAQYRERLKMVRREVQTLAWNRVRTDIPGFAINY